MKTFDHNCGSPVHVCRCLGRPGAVDGRVRRKRPLVNPSPRARRPAPGGIEFPISYQSVCSPAA